MSCLVSIRLKGFRGRIIVIIELKDEENNKLQA